MPVTTTQNGIWQRTLRQPISYVGIGLHSGRHCSLVVQPAPPNTGITFLRKDAPPGEGLVPARWYHAVDSELCTTLRNAHGVEVATVEHLLAALAGCGVDNALIELDGPEVPIMDGSADPFVATIEHIGTVNQPAHRYVLWVRRPVEVSEGDRFAALMPSLTPRITVSIDFSAPAVGRQTYSVELVNEAFRRDVARARTFGFLAQIDELRRRGLVQGGSLRNAVLVDGERIVNEEGLRFHDEFVRHKVLDTLGDLTLAGVPILGHAFTYKPGHQLNVALLRALFADPGAWSYIAMDELRGLLQRGAKAEAEADEEATGELNPLSDAG